MKIKTQDRRNFERSYLGFTNLYPLASKGKDYPPLSLRKRAECVSFVIINTFLCLVLLSVLLSGYSYAGVWRDTFDGYELNGWKRTAKRNTGSPRWEVVEGFLFAKIERSGIQASCGKNSADFLHWNAHEFQLDRLTVIGTKIKYLQEGFYGLGELCLFLGKREPTPDFAVVGLFSFIDIHFIKLTVSKGFDAYSFILSAIRVMP